MSKTKLLSLGLWWTLGLVGSVKIWGWWGAAVYVGLGSVVEFILAESRASQ